MMSKDNFNWDGEDVIFTDEELMEAQLILDEDEHNFDADMMKDFMEADLNPEEM